MPGVLRCLYVDLDGTLVGRGGSLLHDSAGNVSMFGPRALEAAHRAGVEIVPVSGRMRWTVREPARAMGCTAFAFEVGGGLVVDGDDYWQTGDLEPVAGESVHDQIASRGVIELLIRQFDGRLELHSPWHLYREVTHIFRGDIDAAEADRLLAAHGSGDLKMIDNGFVGGLGDSSLDPSIEMPRSFHLTPRATSKAAAVARHRAIRGYDREETIAVGDSAEDVGMASEVGAFWLVAGALEHDPAVAPALAGHGNIVHAEGGAGEAVYEAVVTTLVTRAS